MPVYEFSCNRCGQEFETLVSGGQQAKCPHCGSGDTAKKVSACARLQTKRSGSQAPASSGGCASCSGGNCASCH